jgi:hypothetical protein
MRAPLICLTLSLGLCLTLSGCASYGHLDPRYQDDNTCSVMVKASDPCPAPCRWTLDSKNHHVPVGSCYLRGTELKKAPQAPFPPDILDDTIAYLSEVVGRCRTPWGNKVVEWSSR